MQHLEHEMELGGGADDLFLQNVTGVFDVEYDVSEHGEEFTAFLEKIHFGNAELPRSFLTDAWGSEYIRRIDANISERLTENPALLSEPVRGAAA